MLNKCCILNVKKCNNNIYLFNMCLNHLKLLYHKKIVFIQSIYRGYKARKYLRLYVLLPYDLQINIKNNINKELYYNRYIKKLNKIIYKYVINIHNYMYMYNSTIKIKDLIKGYKLYNKYFEIIHINNLKHFLTIGFQIYKYIDDFMISNTIDVIHLMYKFPILCKIDTNKSTNESISDEIKILKEEILIFYIRYYYSIHHNSNYRHNNLYI